MLYFKQSTLSETTSPMTHEELRQYFDLGEPDEHDTISISSMRRILYDYAQNFGIELRIQEHLPGNQRVRFELFTDYFLRNTTETALMAYHPSGQLRWKSNLPETPLEESLDTPQAPTEMLPPSEEEQAVSMDMALEILSSLQDNTGTVSFADFLRFHNPDADEFRTLNLKI